MPQPLLETDVLVVGAGASGIPAALAAARMGARVVLLEEDPVVGGATTDFYVDMFCGGPKTGTVKETDDLLKKNHSLREGGGTFFLPSAFLRTYAGMLAREKNIQVVCGARAVGVLQHQLGFNARVEGVSADIGAGCLLEVRSKVTVDATGTGAVAILAGCHAMYGRESQAEYHEPHAPATADLAVQQCTWMYISQQLGDGESFDMTKLDHVRMGVLVDGLGWFHDEPEKAMSLRPRIYLHWGCAVQCENTRDSLAIARAQSDALAVMERDHALLRENGYAVYLAPRLGVRETTRIVGKHVVTENDLRSGVLPTDTIAVGTYGLDLWGQTLSSRETRTPMYGIPYRALVPAEVDGLLLAGKAISGTHIAMSAYRVMPIMGSVGQSAGIAAALCAARGDSPNNIDPEDVRSIARSPSQNMDIGR